jgi:hypothetical protein
MGSEVGALCTAAAVIARDTDYNNIGTVIIGNDLGCPDSIAHSST